MVKHTIARQTQETSIDDSNKIHVKEPIIQELEELKNTVEEELIRRINLENTPPKCESCGKAKELTHVDFFANHYDCMNKECHIYQKRESKRQEYLEYINRTRLQKIKDWFKLKIKHV